MKIRIISNKKQFKNLLDEDKLNDDKYVHFSFLPAYGTIFALIHRCRSIKFIHLSYSSCERLSKKANRLLKKNSIEILRGLEVWGAHMDSDGYFEIDLSKISELQNNYDENGTVRFNEVTEAIRNEFGFEKDLTDYVIRSEIFPHLQKEAFENLKQSLTEVATGE